MSVEELIEFAVALPKDEQIRLIEAVQESRFTKLEREFAAAIPPGFAVERLCYLT